MKRYRYTLKISSGNIPLELLQLPPISFAIFLTALLLSLTTD